MSNASTLQLLLQMKLAETQLMYVVEVREAQAPTTTLRVNHLSIGVALGREDEDRSVGEVADRLWARILVAREDMKGRRFHREVEPSTLSDKEERNIRRLRRAILKLHQKKKQLEEKIPS